MYVLMSGLDYERLVLSAGPLGIMQVGMGGWVRGGGGVRGVRVGGNTLVGEMGQEIEAGQGRAGLRPLAGRPELGFCHM